jgi:serine/threonine protein kinase
VSYSDLFVCSIGRPDLLDIIHGDIKPQNVLVFKVDSGSYTAKLADFGYSTAVADDGLINMPKSKHWNAPEHHHRGFKFSEAMKMDAYSFGILCLWLIFYNSKEYPDRNFFDDLESDDKLPALALANQLITTSPMLDDEWQSNLDQVFNLILVHNPEDRSFDFEQLLHLLGQDR